MDSAQLIASLLGAGGGGAVLTAAITGLVKWKSGEAGRERVRNTNLESQRMKAIEERDKANEERDMAAVRRRQTEEYASRLRRQLIENGITPGEWPDLSKTITPAELKRARKESKE
ncbi:MAG: hypothetical protein WED09_07170 [Homoserinimonas sp.]